jgi:hypothetical protein
MDRPRQKNTLVRRRVADVERELAQVQENIRALAKAAERPDGGDLFRKLPDVTPLPERTLAAVPAKPDSRSQVAAAAKPKQAELFGTVPQAGVTMQPGAIPQRPAAASKPAPAEKDPRFANYFVTSGLQAVRPLRQERRIQRNRALLMVIIAAILLFGVIKFLLF